MGIIKNENCSNRHLSLRLWMLILVCFWFGRENGLGNWEQKLANCPTHVQHQGQFKEAGELGRTGRMVFQGSSGHLYSSNLDGTDLKQCPAESKGALLTQFSPNGSFVIASRIGKSAYLFSSDCSRAHELPFEFAPKEAKFYYASPRENHTNSHYEIAYVKKGGTELWARMIDLSSETPQWMGEPRKIGDGLPAQNADGFILSGSHLVWDTKSKAHLYTIPEGGNGKAEPSTQFGIKGMGKNCGIAMSLDGKVWTTNLDSKVAAKDVCIPGNSGSHQGFVVYKTRHYQEKSVDIKEYTLDPSQGALSVSWAPKVYQGKVTRVDSKNAASWFPLSWTNDPDLFSVMMLKYPGTPNAFNFIYDYTRDVYYRIGPQGQSVSWAAVWFDRGNYPPQNSAASIGFFRPDESKRIQAFDLDLNILGRELPSRLRSFPLRGREK